MFVLSQAPFFFLSHPLLVTRYVKRNRPGGSTAETCDLNWPNGHPTPWNIMPVCKLGDLPQGWMIWGWEGGVWHWSVNGEQSHCASPLSVFLPFYYHHYYYLPLSSYWTIFSVIKLFLYQHTNFTSIPLHIPPESGINRGVVRASACVSSPAGLKTSTPIYPVITCKASAAR